jgi:hypothetical protein
MNDEENITLYVRVKGKAIPLQAWTYPRHMVVTLSALRTGRLYPQENIPGTHFC